MSLRTKLFLSLLVIAVVPISIAHFLTYQEARSELIERIISQLSSLASVQDERTTEVVMRYLDDVRLVASRTQLRLSLKAHNEEPTPEHQQKMLRIITDARDSTPNIEIVTVRALDGKVVISTSKQQPKVTYDYDVAATDFSIQTLYKEEEQLKVVVAGPFILNKEVIGLVEVVASAEPLLAVTRDYTGLGESGEVILATKNEHGDALFLTPLRFDEQAALRRVVRKEQTEIPMTTAIAGREIIQTEEYITDYRGERVFAATQFIDVVGWGLVVKIDRSEALAPVTALATSYLATIAIVFTLVLLCAFLFARAVTKPLSELVVFAESMEQGNFSQQVDVRSGNEIGLLARTMNTMSTRLRELYAELNKKVEDRTQRLAQLAAVDEAMLMSIGDAVVATDETGCITTVNEACLNILGLERKNVLKKPLVEVLTMYDDKGKCVPPNERYITTVLKTKVTMQNERTVYYKAKDGIKIPIHLSISPVTLKDRSLVGTISVFRDVTREKAAEQAKDEFVSLASHQLRTPLSIINWYTEMLQDTADDSLNEKQQSYLKEIADGDKRMVKLVNALLNVSRLDLGTYSIDTESVVLKELIQHVAKPYQQLLEQKQIVYTEKIDETLTSVTADPVILELVFDNLLSNAVKYTPEVGVIMVHLRDVDADCFEYIVTDSGYGIPEEQQAKIFTKMFRADNVTEQDTDGTGLGLYMVKSLVESVNGSIRFTSDGSSGTTFIVRIPKVMKNREGTGRLS